MRSDTEPSEWEFQIPVPGIVGAEQRALGPCWFWCGYRVSPVVWIGCLTSEGATAPLYACDACLRQLAAMAWDFTDAERAAPRAPDGRALEPYRPPGDAWTSRRRRGRWQPRARTTFGTRFWTGACPS
ncbi:hypothetical protein [Streptomyces sedi]|uniref:Uncharacterized protein n=1 Tax=Streptomyces sedi TaxID=555059 RepID=A0A5C4VE84_9ACTN|nr:hypothetical protein [Streptomyces sedi]TNM34237.1 hypothetical protein FH715_00625 [Streptomyces sedi]